MFGVYIKNTGKIDLISREYTEDDERTVESLAKENECDVFVLLPVQVFEAERQIVITSKKLNPFQAKITLETTPLEVEGIEEKQDNMTRLLLKNAGITPLTNITETKSDVESYNEIIEGKDTEKKLEIESPETLKSVEVLTAGTTELINETIADIEENIASVQDCQDSYDEEEHGEELNSNDNLTSLELITNLGDAINKINLSFSVKNLISLVENIPMEIRQNQLFKDAYNTRKFLHNNPEKDSIDQAIKNIQETKTPDELTKLTEKYSDPYYSMNDDFILACDSKRNRYNKALFDELVEALATANNLDEIKVVANSEKFKVLLMTEYKKRYQVQIDSRIFNLQLEVAMSQVLRSNSLEHLEIVTKPHPENIKSHEAYIKVLNKKIDEHNQANSDKAEKEKASHTGLTPKEKILAQINECKTRDRLVVVFETIKEKNPDLKKETWHLKAYEEKYNSFPASKSATVK